MTRSNYKTGMVVDPYVVITSPGSSEEQQFRQRFCNFKIEETPNGESRTLKVVRKGMPLLKSEINHKVFARKLSGPESNHFVWMYWSVAKFDGQLFVMPDGTGIGFGYDPKNSQYANRTYIEFGCTHQWQEVYGEVASKLGFRRTGNCQHCRVCTICGVKRLDDSSD